MADGKITFLTKIDNTQVDKDLQQLENKIRKAEESISKNENAKLPLVNQAKELGAKLDEAKANAELLREEMAAINSAMAPGSAPDDYAAASANLPKVQAALQSQEKEVATLQRQWDKVNNKIDAYDVKIKTARASIATNTQKATALLETQNSSGAKLQRVFAKARTSAAQYGKQLLAITKSMILFRVFSAVINSISKYMNRILKTNEEYTSQMAQLKAALVTAFQPIYEFILPGLMAVMKVLTSIVMVVANVLSALSGKTLAQSSKNAKALNEEADALENVGGAAKDAGKSLANFDEINTLSTGDAGGGASGVGAGSKYDFGEFDTAQYKAKIDELTVYLSGALLAIGAILAFSGANIPLGIALMAAGALGMVAVVKENWGHMSDELKGAISKVLLVLGGAALVLGAILTFSGANIPLGIALMVAGAVALWSAAKLNWSAIETMMQGPVGKITALVSGALLAVGAILAFTGVALPLGIAMMALGAAGLATVTALNWNTIKEKLQGPVGIITALASGALLAIGVLLAFSGVALPIGIAMIALGAAGLVSVAVLNWNTIKSKIEDLIGQITPKGGAAMLVMGAVLAFSGMNIPLGIAMMAAGGAGLLGVKELNWSAIKDALVNAWEGIKSWFNQSVSPKLTLSYWQGKLANIGTGIKAAFKNGINAAITLFNQFISWINTKMKFSWGDKYLLGKKIISAGSIQLVSIPQIPYLAQGAVLPPNKPFMAMVGDQKNGTNIEAPLATIQEALANVLTAQGARNINITFTGDLAQLGRVLRPVIEHENNRVGGSLAKG